MLELLNQYGHGFVAIPTIVACRRAGVFEALNSRNDVTESLLVEQLQANSGHLRVALKLLQSIDWISQAPDGLISLKATHSAIDEIPDDILEFWQFPLRSYLSGGEEESSIRPWIRRCRESWNVSNSRSRVMLDGVLVVPILTELHWAGYLRPDLTPDSEEFLSNVSQHARMELSELFAHLGWRETPEADSKLTEVGRFMFNRALNVGTLCAYIPMLSHLTNLLTGDVSTVFARDQHGHEQHVERTLNVVASGFQHEKYFADVDQILASVFDTPELSSQPRYIADMGCGDGSFLMRVHETIVSKTVRGKHLDDYPLVLVGVDFNEKALVATAETLRDVPHLVLRGDIGDPEGLMNALKQAGIADPSSVMHIRSFLDHDRPLLPPQDEDQLERRRQISYSGAYVDKNGAAVEPAIVVQSLVEHLGRWSKVVTGPGLIVLEVHSMPPDAAGRYFDQSESLHFDAYHGYSMQYLVDADVFMMCAAEVGLFANPDRFRRYPKTLPFCRITLSCFEQREYSARHMHPDDLTSVCALVNHGESTGMKIPNELVRRIVAADPLSSFVVEFRGEIVASAVCLRISDPEVLFNARLASIDDLHAPDGSTIALLEFKVAPEFTEHAPAIIEFFLQQSRLKTEITSAAAIASSTSLSRGWHESCGGAVSQPTFSHLAADAGALALVSYDFESPSSTSTVNAAAAEREVVDVGVFVEQLVQQLMEGNVDRYCPTKTLYELGFDSLDHMELATTLKKKLGLEIDANLLFEYDTPQKLSEHLRSVTSKESQRGSRFAFWRRSSR
ncbi:MAG: acyl carrier protein [Planctomycetaceae bacterium]|nr:acyl carrier protein [Planctomycetales bacterium]MCB9926299.1 acyl carrier protein [Planctomycetaceae bacterium]